MANAKRDQNYVPAIQGVSSLDGLTPTNIWVDPTTHGIIVDGTSLYSQLDPRYLKLDQSTPQTLTASPIFNNLTAGRILFASATKTLTDDSSLFWDNTNKRLGIGTTSPQAVLHINGATGENQHVRLSAYNNNVGWSAYRANGTEASPTALVSGNAIFQFGGRGYGATGYSSLDRVQISLSAGENWTDSAQGTYIIFGTTENGTTTRSEKMRITGSGLVGIGTTSPTAQLQVHSGSDSTITQIIRGASSQSANLTEWQDSSGTVLTAILPAGSIQMEATTSATSGVIRKGANRFIHTFSHPTGSTAKPDGFNTFVGELAGNFTMGSTATNTYDSSYNSIVGYRAFESNTLGRANSGIGRFVLRFNTTGRFNSALGDSALYYNTNGVSNMAIGFASLYSNTTGGSNSAIGSYSLYSNTTGSNNIAIGDNAGRYIADGSTANSTSGTSLYLGSLTKALANGGANEIVIGHNAIGNGSNTVTLGNTSIATTVLRGRVGISTTSPTAQLQVHSGSDSTITQILRGATSQTANLTEWQNSSGTVLASVTSAGRYTGVGASLSSGNVIGDTTSHVGFSMTSTRLITVANANNQLANRYYLNIMASSGVTLSGVASANLGYLNIRSDHRGELLNASGLYNLINVETGALGNIYNLYGYFDNYGGAGTTAITNAYGIKLSDYAGTITNKYALYINSQTSASNNYAIYTNAGLVRFGDKVIFTQTDGNEYIDSLNDGYMDYGATTLHRFNQSIDITGNCEADTYSVGGVAGIDKSITVLDADGTTTHALTFSKGILTACVTT